MPRKQRGPRPKHVPQRTCIACKEVAGKRTLIRLVRTPDGVVADSTGKLAGRGAYLCTSQACWETALNGRQIERALRTKLRPEERDALAKFMQTLLTTHTQRHGNV